MAVHPGPNLDPSQDVLYLVAEFIEPNPLVFIRLSQVSRGFRHVFTSDRVWRYLNPYNHQTGIYARFLQSPNLQQVYRCWKGAHNCSSADLNEVLGALVTAGSGGQVEAPADRHLFWCAIHINVQSLEWAPREIILDRELRRVAISKSINCVPFLAGEDLTGNEALALVAAYGDHSQCPPRLFEMLPNHVLGDFSVAMAMVGVCGESYTLLASELKLDRQIVLQAVRTHGNIVTETNFLGDREIVLKALETDYTVLSEASQFADDAEVVRHAIKFSSEALVYASQRLRGDQGTVMLAVQRDGSALAYASRKMQDTEEIVRTAVANDPSAIMHASRRLQAL